MSLKPVRAEKGRLQPEDLLSERIEGFVGGRDRGQSLLAGLSADVAFAARDATHGRAPEPFLRGIGRSQPDDIPVRFARAVVLQEVNGALFPLGCLAKTAGARTVKPPTS